MLITVNTADGMLTKATPKIVPGKRARKITVSSRKSGEITVSVSPNFIISFIDDVNSLIPMSLKTKTSMTCWLGSAWNVTNTDDWHTNRYILTEKNAVIASNYEEAVIEHLRHILNVMCCIRPVVTESVCQRVATILVLDGKEHHSTFIGARKKMNG